VTSPTIRKLAVLIHADVAASTALVQRHKALAHQRIQSCFKGFIEIIADYGGSTRELRGDVLIAEFERAADAVCAALAFQIAQGDFIARLDDDIRPVPRVGIAIGEVIIADHSITGAGIVMAQRLEQLAPPGGVIIQGAAYETLPRQLPFDYQDLGEQFLRGFDARVRALQVTLRAGAQLPEPEPPRAAGGV
jgi:adenylate cyclase